MSEQRYLVTARKYRPARFREIVAQEHVTETLRNALRLDRLAHAYLFCGPRGVGKTTAARILAKAINCTERDQDTAEPCRSCTSCRDFESGRSLSIFEIDAASNNKVEDVRELRETVRIPPQGSLKKVYIIDEVHMLSNAAFNALLKTLEEPPPHVLFIFATTEPHKVLPTILSRCQRFDFRRIPLTDIVSRLEEIGQQEGITADEESLLLIGRKGDGSLRDALSAFDQAVALCGTTLQYSSLAEALRVIDIDLYFETTTNVLDRSSGGMLKLVERIVLDGLDLQEFLVGLAEHLRNLLVARSLGEASLVEAAAATRARYNRESGAFTEPLLLRLLMIVDEAAASISQSAYPRLKLELALIKMASLSSALSLAKAMKQLDRLEELAREGKLAPELFAAPPSPAPRHAAEAKRSNPPSRAPEPVPDATNVVADQGLGGLFGQESSTESNPRAVSTEGNTAIAARTEPLSALWPQFKGRVEKQRIHIGLMLDNSVVLEEVQGTLRIGLPSRHAVEVLAGAEQFLLEELDAACGRRLRRMEFVYREELAASDSSNDMSSAESRREDLEKQRQENPVIRSIIEQFGGELVW